MNAPRDDDLELIRHHVSAISLISGGSRTQSVKVFVKQSDLVPKRPERQVKGIKAFGSYGSSSLLLDTHLQLLKEDYLRALAKQLDELRSSPKIFYSTCYRVKSAKEERDGTYSLKFNASRFQHGRCDAEKSFLHGNIVLLCLNHKINEVVIAMITESDPKQIPRGKVGVEIVDNSVASWFQNRYGRYPFYMVESLNFYFPYHYVVNELMKSVSGCSSAIKSLNSEIVHCAFPSAKPKYLSKTRLWESLLEQHCEDLNPSQRDAFKSVMAHRVALIQGPPGTGKTFVGVRIAKFFTMLKENYPEAIPGPILVLSTTNHAVDDFLSRCMAFTEKIIHGYSKKHDKTSYGALQDMYNRNRHSGDDVKLMAVAHIVGMTTTRGAYMRTSLDKLKISIVIVEEAGDVLESFVLASLPQSTLHLIQIGDHKQLRPSCYHQPMATTHNLELSLFERLIQNGADCPMLNEQRRMRPAFSILIRSIYPALMDHTSTFNRPPIEGVDIPFCFLTHNHEEQRVRNGYTNVWEAEFAVYLSVFLSHQGYGDEDIVILTTYRKQLNLIHTEIRRRHPYLDVQASTVDSFQGKEAKLVILSLVRSNEHGRIGFLKLENRACVALSRARDGFFILGNLDSFVASEAPVWKDVQKVLVSKELVRKELPVKCKHGKKFSCATASDIGNAILGCVICEEHLALMRVENDVDDCKRVIEITEKEISSCSSLPVTDEETRDNLKAHLLDLQMKRQAELSKLRRLSLVQNKLQLRVAKVDSLLKLGLINAQTDTLKTLESKLSI